MDVFDTASEKVSSLTGKSLRDSKIIVEKVFDEFCRINEINHLAMFLAIIQDKMQIVVTSDILGPEISFVAAIDN